MMCVVFYCDDPYCNREQAYPLSTLTDACADDGCFSYAVSLAALDGWDIELPDDERLTNGDFRELCPKHSSHRIGGTLRVRVPQQPDEQALEVMQGLAVLERDAKAIGMPGVDKRIREALREADKFF